MFILSITRQTQDIELLYAFIYLYIHTKLCLSDFHNMNRLIFKIFFLFAYYSVKHQIYVHISYQCINSHPLKFEKLPKQIKDVEEYNKNFINVLKIFKSRIESIFFGICFFCNCKDTKHLTKLNPKNNNLSHNILWSTESNVISRKYPCALKFFGRRSKSKFIMHVNRITISTMTKHL